MAVLLGKWRRDRDSNPGYSCEHNGFRDRPVRPLRHLSAVEIAGFFCSAIIFATGFATGSGQVAFFSALRSAVSTFSAASF